MIKNKMIVQHMFVLLLLISAGCGLLPKGKLATPFDGQTAKISGSVTNGASDSISSGKLGLSSRNILSNAEVVNNSCSQGFYITQLVGGGGAVFSVGEFSNGEFQMSEIPVQQELIISFSCGGGASLRCLAKSGDTGILCNPVADAVLSAFEITLGKITNAEFNGKPISKVAASIVEASQNDSTAAEAFNAEIASCRADPLVADVCYQNAILASVFSGSFKMMQSMAQGHWGVDTLFNMVADVLGFEIDVDSMIYSDFGSKMDSWLGTDFIKKSREFVSQVIEAQLKGSENSSVIKIECAMGYTKYHAHGKFRYSPVMETIDEISQPSCKNTEALLANGLTDEYIQKIYDQMDHPKNHYIQLKKAECRNGGGGAEWDNPEYFCIEHPKLSVTSKFKEANRNDQDGTKGGNNSQTYTLSMIDVFPELFVSLDALMRSDFNTQNHCATMLPDQEGPPVVESSELCQTWFGNWAKKEKSNFSGLLGLYLYLQSSASENGLLSLNDIHTIFTGDKYLNSRLTGWGQGMTGRQSSDGRSYVSPVLVPEGDHYSILEIFHWNFPFPNDVIGDGLLTSAMESSIVPFSETFKMFEKIPTSNVIHNYVFGSAHHEEWNPLGSKFFWSATVQTSGIPIFCKMTDTVSGKATERELNEQTRIECLDKEGLVALGVETGANEKGEVALPPGFNYPYVLQERGWMGDDRGRIYALADRKTGQMIRPGDKEVLIEQMHPQNLDGKCSTEKQAGSVLTVQLRYGSGSDTRDEAVEAYCLDMSAFTISSQVRFYWGGNLEITERDHYGNTWKSTIGQVGRVNLAVDSTDISPVCYYAPTGNFKIDAQSKLVSSDGAKIEDGIITSIGEGETQATIAPCSTVVEKTTKYYLVQMGNTSSSEEKKELRAYLVLASGANDKLMHQNWGPDVHRWEDLFVSINTDVMEAALNLAGGKNMVAPTVAPTYTSWTKLLNQKHNAKFDPYCDDVTGPNQVPNGRCDCYAKGTHDFKNPDECTLEDDAAESTISSPPYWVGDSKTAIYEEIFAKFGGKSGEDLHYVDSDQKIEFNGEYFRTKQAWLNTDDVFQCANLKTGESTYRKPTYVRWDGFWLNHEGCPDAEGEMVGGVIRLINPKPMNNAYSVERPNTLVKLINFATKTVGQGIEIAPADKVFTFDEALALIALRYQMPPDHIRVMDSGHEVKGVNPHFESIRSQDHHSDPAGAILRGLSHPGELTH